jgi:hypothetical protein
LFKSLSQSRNLVLHRDPVDTGDDDISLLVWGDSAPGEAVVERAKTTAASQCLPRGQSKHLDAIGGVSRVADTYTKQAITPNPEPTILKDAIEGSSDCVQRWVKVQTLAHRQRALDSLKLQHNGTAFLDLRVNALVAPTIVSEIDRLQEHS